MLLYLSRCREMSEKMAMLALRFSCLVLLPEVCLVCSEELPATSTPGSAASSSKSPGAESNLRWESRGFVVLFHRDDDIALFVSCIDIPVGFGSLF
jgi:hypothetical protein